jgi:two-component system heavy metal sensor histidine kinase CusS
LTAELNGLRIVVENPGEAIAPEHLPKLFDRFYRIDPARQRSNESAGLGLAIVKSIVEAHGGQIAVRSNTTHTHFQLDFPIK